MLKRWVMDGHYGSLPLCTARIDRSGAGGWRSRGMQMIEGLYLYELILLVLGCVLFVALIFALFFQIRHSENLVVLVPLFLVAIAMIAYPSVQEIQFKDGLLTITKYTQTVQQDPVNATTRTALQQAVNKISPRLVAVTNNADNLAVVASAQYALGDESAAAWNLSRAVSIDPHAPSAVALQHRIDTVHSLASLTATVQAQPANSAAAANLEEVVRNASQLHLANPRAILKVAEAQAALGQKPQAAANTQRVLTIEPNSSSALRLQQQLHTPARN